MNKNRKISKKKRSSNRKRTMKGGYGSVSFPLTLSNNDVAASPQSYLPFNNYSNDPGYSVIGARNTGPFLTGGKKTKSRKNKNKKNKRMHGGSGVSTTMSNGLNTATNSIGIMQIPALNETSGVSGAMSQFSGTGSAYSPMPVKMAPLA